MHACPITGCPASRQHMSTESFVRHLTHIQAGQAVPQNTLDCLGMQVCTPCRHLVRKGSECSFCANKARHRSNVGESNGAAVNEALGSPAPAIRPQSGTRLTDPCPVFKPTIDEVLRARLSTARQIPNPCRRDFAHLLGQALVTLAEEPTWEATYQLMTLAKLTLWVAPQKGSAHPRHLQLEIQRRFRLFEDGAYDTLRTEATLGMKPDGTRPRTRLATRQQQDTTLEDLPQQTVDTIRGLVEEGAFSKAAKHLISEGLADVDDPEVATKLRDLHPRGSPVKLGEDEELPASIPAEYGYVEADWEQQALRAIASFPPGSAPGPNGLRPAHLKDCLKRAGATAALRVGLGKFVLKACKGNLPLAIQTYLCSSTLVPLKKKDGGIRPIAVGDTIRRLVGKVLLRTPEVMDEIETLHPRQCGVGVPFTAETVGMGLQRVSDYVTNPWVGLQVDAFNCVDRTAMLEGALRTAPSTYSWLA